MLEMLTFVIWALEMKAFESENVDVLGWKLILYLADEEMDVLFVLDFRMKRALEGKMWVYWAGN